MAKPIRLDPQARADLFEVVVWYEEKAEGLGWDFLTVFDEAMSTLGASPEGFPIAFDQVRRLVLRRSPSSSSTWWKT